MNSLTIKAPTDGSQVIPENDRPSSPGNTDSCLATEENLPSASSYFLHTPLPTVPSSHIATTTTSSPSNIVTSDQLVTSLSNSTSEPALSPGVPLLLNPELMKGTGIHIVSPQVHVSINAK